MAAGKAEPPKLGISEALKLQSELLEAFSDPDFQAQVKALQESLNDDKKFVAERGKLYLAIQKVVLPRYGFEASQRGAMQMMGVLNNPELLTDPQFFFNATKLTGLLFPERPEWLPQLPPDDIQPTQESKSQANVEPPKFSLQQAIKLQTDLLSAFSDADFQATVQEMKDRFKDSSKMQFNKERSKLYFSIHEVVLPKHGFEGSPKGVAEMNAVMNTPMFLTDPKFFELSAELMNLLFPDRPDFHPAAQLKAHGLQLAAKPQSQQGQLPKVEGKEAAAKKAAAEEVEVVVKHVVTAEEVTVTVLSTATIRDVKDALAKKIGRPVTEARMVRKSGGSLTSFLDKEALGTRRNLLVTGTDDLKFAKGAGKPDLSRTDAFKLQRALLNGFSDAAFQKELQDIRKRNPDSKSAAFLQAFSDHTFTVQKNLLLKYGFESSRQGVKEMVKQLDKWSESERDMFQTGTEINVLLGILTREQADSLLATESSQPVRQQPPQQQTQPKPAAPLPQAQQQQQASGPQPEQSQDAHMQRLDVGPSGTEVQVNVKHAVTGEELVVGVGSSATVQDVKDAVAMKLGQSGHDWRMVRKIGDSITPFSGKESLGTRRKLMITGPASLKVSSETSAPSLTRDEAFSMQKELLAGFSSSLWQKRLEEIRRNHPDHKSAAYIQAFADHCLTVQKKVLLKHGFQENHKGVREMAKLLFRWSQADPDFLDIGIQIDTILGVNASGGPPQGPTDSPAAGKAKSAPGKKTEVRDLELQQALSLQRDLVAAYRDEQFQRQLQNLGREHQKGSKPWIAERQRMVDSVQQEVLPKHGFEPTQRGVAVMVAAFDRFNGDSQVDTLNFQISALSDAYDLDLARRHAAGTEVNLTVKHATKDGETASIPVLSTSLMSDVKMQLARHLRRGDIITDAQLVWTVGTRSGFDIFKDTDQLGGRRNILITGVDNLKAAPEDILMDPLPMFAQNPPASFAQNQAAPEGALTLLEHGSQTKDSPAAQTEKKVQVVVKSATNEKEEIKVSVVESATIKDVKEAVASELGRPSILPTCRIVRKVGNGFVPFVDSESVGVRRRLLIEGVDNLKTAEASVPSLSRAEALSMQKELLAGFLSAAWQREFDEIKSNHPDQTTSAYRKAVKDHCFSVQQGVLLKHGFQDNEKGLQEMVQLLFGWSQADPEFAEAGTQIDTLLGTASARRTAS